VDESSGQQRLIRVTADVRLLERVEKHTAIALERRCATAKDGIGLPLSRLQICLRGDGAEGQCLGARKGRKRGLITHNSPGSSRLATTDTSGLVGRWAPALVLR